MHKPLLAVVYDIGWLFIMIAVRGGLGPLSGLISRFRNFRDILHRFPDRGGADYINSGLYNNHFRNTPDLAQQPLFIPNLPD